MCLSGRCGTLLFCEPYEVLRLMLHLNLWYRKKQSTGFYICRLYKYTGNMSYLLTCLYFHIDAYLRFISLCFVNGNLFCLTCQKDHCKITTTTRKLFNKNVTNQLCWPYALCNAFSHFSLWLFHVINPHEKPREGNSKIMVSTVFGSIIHSSATSGSCPECLCSGLKP